MVLEFFGMRKHGASPGATSLYDENGGMVKLIDDAVHEGEALRVGGMNVIMFDSEDNRRHVSLSVNAGVNIGYRKDTLAQASGIAIGMHVSSFMDRVELMCP